MNIIDINLAIMLVFTNNKLNGANMDLIKTYCCYLIISNLRIWSEIWE